MGNETGKTARELTKNIIQHLDFIQIYTIDTEILTSNAKREPFPAEPLVMALLLSQHKMIDWLSKQISKYKLPINNNVIKKSEQDEPVLGRENLHDYIRKNDGRIHYIDD